MNLKYAISAAFAAGALVATPVIAQNAYSDSEPQFYRLDKNNDGNVGKDEAQAHPWLQRNFSRFDHDNDGKLGKDEFAEAVSAHRAARGNTGAAGGTRPPANDIFENLDKNKDGNIDATEAQARPWLQRNFSTYDHDHDGKLGKDEFAEALNAQRSGRR